MALTGRPDVSDQVIHFIKGADDNDAYEVIDAIIRDGHLLGGTGMIRGEYPCVCFTETPLHLIAPTLAGASARGVRYRPFGVAVDKKWLFESGGRPVIYGPPEDYDALPENLRWRFVRFQPTATPAIDWTWEREWRISTPEFRISPASVTILAPNEEWVDRLETAYEDREAERAAQNDCLLGLPRGAHSVGRCPWNVRAIE